MTSSQLWDVSEDPKTSLREVLNYMGSFDMLNYMGSIVGGVINLLRLNAVVDVTMDMLKNMWNS